MTEGIELLDSAKNELQEALNSFSSKKSFHYADLRIEFVEAKAVSTQNAELKGAYEDYELALGARVYAKDKKFIASGMAGTSINAEQLSNVKKIFNAVLEESFNKAKQSLEQKKKLMKKNPWIDVSGNQLAEVKVYQDTIKFLFKKNPRDIDLDEMISLTKSHSENVQKISGVASAILGIVSGFERKILASSEGALIDQTWPLTEAFFFVVAKGKAMESYYETLGERLGLEVFDGVNGFNQSLEEFISNIAKGTVELSNAKAMKTSSNVSVITDGWFNSLLVHEICGHPVEADRALKKEAAWAGRAWWFNDLNDNMLGKKVASEKVTVFSDASLEGYGHFNYDDEGVKAKKSVNIDKGILNEFLNSRETAALLNQPANAAMRATTASAVPIIRMTNTCFDKGEWNAEEIISDTRNGYYLVGRKIPSIGETRQNFRITAWKTFRVENGEIKELYRAGGLTADSFAYLSSINAVGKDFGMYNVPNCGKGTPMQVMKLGNGAPTMRGVGTVSGEN